MPGTAMRSFSVTSRSDLMAGLRVVMVMPPEAEPPSPITSSFGLPLALAHSVRKPPVPVEAMSMEPARMASLMWLPPSISRNSVLTSPRPAAAACFCSRPFASMT